MTSPAADSTPTPNPDQHDDAITLTLVIDASGLDKRSATSAIARTIASACTPSTGNEWDEVLVVGNGRRSKDAVSRAATVSKVPVAKLTPQPRAVPRWTEATGAHVVFLQAGCELVSHATGSLRHLIRHNPSVEFAYFDSTGFDVEQPHCLLDPCHRPGYSPERLRAQMYLGEMFLVAGQVGRAFDSEGSLLSAPPEHGTIGRLADRCGTVAHLPQLLYRYPIGGELPTPTPVAERLAGVQQRLTEEGFPATAMLRSGSDAIIDLEPCLITTPQVSVVIPTNGAQRSIDDRSVVLCLQAIDSIIARTSYVDFELVVVITPGAPPDLAADILATIEARTGARQPTVRFCRDDRPFNFSNACNRGAIAAAGDVLVFLNDDTVIQSRNWLDRLVMYATRPDIGAVGARLLYGDGTIQHAGIWARGGHPTHRYEGTAAAHAGYMDALTVPQNCLAVTGACLAVTADKFRAVGGFSPEFASSYNDVDLCLKLDDVGWRTVVDPFTVLTHFEASSRDPKIEDWELALLHDRWRSVLVHDRFDNPHHLAPGSEEFPAPDPDITEQKRLAGWVDFEPRLWPLPQLTLDLDDDAATGAGGLVHDGWARTGGEQHASRQGSGGKTPGGATTDSGGEPTEYSLSGR